MKQKFDIILLEEVWEFFETLNEKTKDKIIYNIDKSKYVNDPELFKKLETDIWEFRTKYSNLHYRIFAFWDKEDNIET
ncbi:MAG: type II toxin-antitoxin system RelE/ParE family toxin, partial [Bacteroidales bacterium]